MLEQAPGRTCGPLERRAHIGAGFLAEFVSLQRTHAGVVLEGLHPMEGICSRGVCEEL